MQIKFSLMDVSKKRISNLTQLTSKCSVYPDRVQDFEKSISFLLRRYWSVMLGYRVPYVRALPSGTHLYRSAAAQSSENICPTPQRDVSLATCYANTSNNEIRVCIVMRGLFEMPRRTISRSPFLDAAQILAEQMARIIKG